jgi:hypothetical protein
VQAALGLDPAADPAQRGQRLVQPAGQGHRPGGDDGEQVLLGLRRAPRQLAGPGRAVQGQRGQLPGAGEVTAPVHRLGELGVLLGGQPEQPPPVGHVGQRVGDPGAPQRLRGGELLEVEQGQRAGEPVVGLVQLPGGLTGRGLVGEQAGVHGQGERGVQPVGGHLQVRQVGQRERPLGGRRAALQVRPGTGDGGGGAVGVAVVQPGAGGERGGPGVPAGGPGGAQDRLGVGELVAEGPGVAGVAGREQPPAGSLQLLLGDGLGPGGHGLLQSTDGRRTACGTGR